MWTQPDKLKHEGDGWAAEEYGCRKYLWLDAFCEMCEKSTNNQMYPNGSLRLFE